MVSTNRCLQNNVLVCQSLCVLVGLHVCTWVVCHDVMVCTCWLVCHSLCACVLLCVLGLCVMMLACVMVCTCWLAQ